MQYDTGNCIYVEYNIDHSAFRPLLAGTNDLCLHFKDLVCYYNGSVFPVTILQ
jgi:hypothetical protein